MKSGTIAKHSARKSAATLAISECTISSSMASICNRAGWKKGGTRDKYIKHESAGDQFLGHTLCGLSSITKKFSISPPLFNPGQREIYEIDKSLQCNVVVSYSTTMFEVWCMCFAQVFYHNIF